MYSEKRNILSLSSRFSNSRTRANETTGSEGWRQSGSQGRGDDRQAGGEGIGATIIRCKIQGGSWRRY